MKLRQWSDLLCGGKPCDAVPDDDDFPCFLCLKGFLPFVKAKINVTVPLKEGMDPGKQQKQKKMYCYVRVKT